MSFDPFKIDLPVTEIVEQVRQQLAQQNTLIVNAPPGAGKSTLLPLVLLDQPWLQGKKIIMLEPRRLAAKTIATRMASLLGDAVGETVGYRIRFENRISNKTKIEVVTEGILTRMLHHDNALEDVGIVIFDEFHERSLHADVAMALCREAQQVLRPDLRIMIMSATLNMPQLTALLKAPVAESKGKQYPVDIIYTNDADETLLPELTARTVMKAVKENEGDVLVFLPGEGEIRKCEELLKDQLFEFSIHPLYGQLPQQEQYAAIMPNKNGKRKIVLATSIAETSLTIEGIRIVVDSGFGRSSRFDSKSGLSRLETLRISKDSADQRAGRAGRLSSGVCYRMWTMATHER
ncbi:MAG: DEAD/DEAH box helicase, partial [Bacteroidia bacterium]